MEIKSSQDKSSPLKRVFGKEIKNLNQTLVTNKKTLRELLEEEEPSAINKKGEKHLFDPEELEKISQILPTYKHSNLKLPLSLYKDTLVKDFYVKEELEAQVVKEILNYNVKTLQGKLFISKPLAHKLLRKLPTTVQLSWLFY